MTQGVELVKGKVMITGKVTAEVRSALSGPYLKRERVELWRAPLADLEFLTRMPKLRSLALVNCGLADGGALRQCVGLRELSLNQLKPTRGWGFLAGLTQIEQLHLLNVRGPLELPDLASMTSLRQLRFWGCKGLRSLAATEALPSLQILECVDTGLSPESFERVLALPGLHTVDCTFSRATEQAVFASMVAARGPATAMEG